MAGLFRPFARFATSIPTPLAQAMLAGVLISLCTRPFVALGTAPETALPILLTWFVAGRINRAFAVPAAVAAALAVTLVAGGGTIPMPDHLLSAPVFTWPSFSLSSALGLGVPLFIVTMATQNIPGIAVLRSFGYEPSPGRLLAGVGSASILSAPFGAPATCVAAITAAMCSNEESHPDPGAAAPAMTLETLAGVALLGVFANSASAALEEVAFREAAAVTFLTTASGMSAFGLSAPVWGLILGGIVHLTAQRLRR